jgi:peptidoglycan/LPS O-acetylase OafA/YrhL
VNGQSTMSAPHRRYASLDLLRALAIVLVVHCHATTHFGNPPEYYVLQLGGKGVELFFVLSGWLLGRQLVQELKETGRVDLKRFWYRRWLRTLPAYYAVLLFTIAWQVYRKNGIDWSYFYFGQTYFSSMPFFGVSWSLCVEEHFYLAIAPLLWMFWRWRFTLLLVPALLALPEVCRHNAWFHSDLETHVRFDPCVTGVLLAAISVTLPSVWKVLSRWAPFFAIIGIAFATRDVVCRLNPDWGCNDIGHLPWSLIFGSWVLWAAARPDAYIPIPGIRYIAERSYAIYLLHGEAFSILKKIHPESFGLYVALTWLIVIPMAEVLYRIVEKPGMMLRERFSSSRSRQNTDKPSTS